jgi:hypothetical protein
MPEADWQRYNGFRLAVCAIVLIIHAKEKLKREGMCYHGVSGWARRFTGEMGGRENA